MSPTSGEDIVEILRVDPRIKGLRLEETTVFVEQKTECISGIRRTIQAAITPCLGQQMLQSGSRCAIAKGINPEESSVLVNSEGVEL